MTETPAYDFGAPAQAVAPAAPQPAVQAPAPSPAAHRESPLDILRKEAQRDVIEFRTYDVEGRPGWQVKFDTNIESDDVKRYQKNAQGKRKRPEDADPIIAAAQPLIERNVAILWNGDVLTDDKGEELLLGSREFISMFGDIDAIYAVRKFLGDGQTLSMGGALYSEAGYGADLVPVDPQKP